jgi:hypothetical protein
MNMPPIIEPNSWYGPGPAAAYLGLDNRELTRLCRLDLGPAHQRYGLKTLRFRGADLTAFKEKHHRGPEQAA